MNIIDLAKQAGVAVQVQEGEIGGNWDVSYIITPELLNFAALVREHTIEEIASKFDFDPWLRSFGISIRRLK